MNDDHLKVFATNLPDDWDYDKIKEYFSAQAPILEVEVFKDHDRSLGCAYITFKKKSEAEEVIKRLSKEVIRLRWADGESERLAHLKELAKVPATAAYVQYTSQDGRPYYYNTLTGTTQWEAPKDVPLQSAAPKFPGHSQGPAGCNLFVFHLPIEWSEAELISYFNPFGNVISSRIMCDKTTGKSKGYGFISYDNQNSAIQAVRMMNGFQVGSKRLKVQIKKGEETPSTAYSAFPPYGNFHEPYLPSKK